MPKPAHIGRKVRVALVAEASLDVAPFAEGLWDCTTVKQLDDAQAKVTDHIAFVRELDSGALSDYRAVDQTQKLIEAEQTLVKEHIGDATVVAAGADKSKAEVSEMKKDIRRQIKQARRLRRAWLECYHWRQAYFEEQRDREAAERLGAAADRD
jgi:hypothetical protein